MRTIKFRAWDKKRRLMVKNCDLDFLNETFETGEYDTEYGKSITIGDDLVVMQFTGLLDKSGKEIYEGDIVREGLGEIGFVEYEKYQFVLKVRDTNFYFNNTDRMEVIGNIYENSNPTIN